MKKRREALIAGGLIFGAGAIGYAHETLTGAQKGNQSTPDPTNTPSLTPETEQSPTTPPNEETIRAFVRNLDNRPVGLGQNTVVLVSPDGSKILVRTELSPMVVEPIALAYADVIDDHPEIGRLTIETRNNRFLVPKMTAKAYAHGRIQKSAYLKTIEQR